jgi:hypothetical protein
VEAQPPHRRGNLYPRSDIEDEDRLSGILKSKLCEIGFTVDIAASAGDASAALELINYDAAVLDRGRKFENRLARDIQ